MTADLKNKCAWEELIKKGGINAQDLLRAREQGRDIPCFNCDGSRSYADEINCRNYFTRKDETRVCKEQAVSVG